MVWIHGGIFAFGSSSMYHPHYFMDHDIILVTINYRLGAFGRNFKKPLVQPLVVQIKPCLYFQVS